MKLIYDVDYVEQEEIEDLFLKIKPLFWMPEKTKEEIRSIRRWDFDFKLWLKEETKKVKNSDNKIEKNLVRINQKVTSENKTRSLLYLAFEMDREDIFEKLIKRGAIIDEDLHLQLRLKSDFRYTKIILIYRLYMREFEFIPKRFFNCGIDRDDLKLCFENKSYIEETYKMFYVSLKYRLFAKNNVEEKESFLKLIEDEIENLNDQLNYIDMLSPKIFSLIESKLRLFDHIKKYNMPASYLKVYELWLLKQLYSKLAKLDLADLREKIFEKTFKIYNMEVIELAFRPEIREKLPEPAKKIIVEELTPKMIEPELRPEFSNFIYRKLDNKSQKIFN